MALALARTLIRHLRYMKLIRVAYARFCPPPISGSINRFITKLRVCRRIAVAASRNLWCQLSFGKYTKVPCTRVHSTPSNLFAVLPPSDLMHLHCSRYCVQVSPKRFMQLPNAPSSCILPLMHFNAAH